MEGVWNIIEEMKEISLTELPRILDGEGFGIIEDIGGVGGLEFFLESVKKGKGEDFEHFEGWFESMGEDIHKFDIEKMDKEDLNFRLKKLIRVYKDICEYRIYPTKKSIGIIEREYMK